MTDYKQLCAELVRIADALDSGTALASNQGQAMDGYFALAAFRDVAYRARAALTEPEPEDPTDEELLRLYKVATPCYHVEEYRRELDLARAVLARWGK